MLGIGYIYIYICWIIPFESIWYWFKFAGFTALVVELYMFIWYWLANCFGSVGVWWHELLGVSITIYRNPRMERASFGCSSFPGFHSTPGWHSSSRVFAGLLCFNLYLPWLKGREKHPTFHQITFAYINRYMCTFLYTMIYIYMYDTSCQRSWKWKMGWYKYIKRISVSGKM